MAEVLQRPGKGVPRECGHPENSRPPLMHMKSRLAVSIISRCGGRENGGCGWQKGQACDEVRPGFAPRSWETRLTARQQSSHQSFIKATATATIPGTTTNRRTHAAQSLETRAQAQSEVESMLTHVLNWLTHVAATSSRTASTAPRSTPSPPPTARQL